LVELEQKGLPGGEGRESEVNIRVKNYILCCRTRDPTAKKKKRCLRGPRQKTRQVGQRKKSDLEKNKQREDRDNKNRQAVT